MAAVVTSSAFNLTREILSETLEKNTGPRTIFASLDSPDRDIRTFLIFDRWCQEFKEMNADY